MLKYLFRKSKKQTSYEFNVGDEILNIKKGGKGYGKRGTIVKINFYRLGNEDEPNFYYIDFGNRHLWCQYSSLQLLKSIMNRNGANK